MRIVIAAIAFFIVSGSGHAIECFKPGKERSAEGLLRLYAATQVCPQFRPMSRGELTGLLALADVLDLRGDVEWCRAVINGVIILSEDVVRNPGVCDEAAALARAQPRVAGRWLKRQ